MQYLKEEVKNRILEAALREFKENGYVDASMRTIAHNAGVALGNVYRYFKNKDELFNEVIEPVYTQLMTVLFDVGKTDDAEQRIQVLYIMDIVEKIMEVFHKYSTEFIILIDKSRGSKYENFTEELINLIENRLKCELVPKFTRIGIEIKDELIIYVVASSLVQGMLVILRNCNDEKRIKELMSQLLILYFNDIIERFK